MDAADKVDSEVDRMVSAAALPQSPCSSSSASPISKGPSVDSLTQGRRLSASATPWNPSWLTKRNHTVVQPSDSQPSSSSTSQIADEFPAAPSSRKAQQEQYSTDADDVVVLDRERLKVPNDVAANEDDLIHYLVGGGYVSTKDTVNAEPLFNFEEWVCSGQQQQGVDETEINRAVDDFYDAESSDSALEADELAWMEEQVQAKENPPDYFF